jgi:hypothetical protein
MMPLPAYASNQKSTSALLHPPNSVFVVDLLYRVRQRFSDAAKREEEPLTEQGFEREELDVNLTPPPSIARIFPAAR